MATDTQLPTYLDVWSRIVNAGEVELFATHFDPAYRFHSPTMSLAGNDEAREHFERLLGAFSDRELSVRDAFEAEGGRIARRWTFRGTHTGDLNGIAATHKRVTLAGMTIAHVVDGRIVEEYDVMDELGLLQQLGVLPTLSD